MLAVDEAFSQIGAVTGKGSAAERKRLVGELFAAATAEEQYFLVRLLSGELRQGALDGVMTDAVAKAAEVPGAEVRRAVMLSGSLAVAAQAALGGGSAALAAFGLQVGRPLKPMLASSEASIDEALARIGGAAAVEWKLDGIRVQAHLADGAVRLFTRSLDDITDRLPEVVTALAALPVRDAVFDGELIALRADGRPYAFQDTASRAASEVDAPMHGAGNRAAVGVPLRRAAPQRHRPDRPARRRAARRAGLRRPRRRCSCRDWSRMIQKRRRRSSKTPSPWAMKASS